MENTEHRQTPTEAAERIAGFCFGAFSAACRGKHMSAAIIVVAGAFLLLGGSSFVFSDTRLFVQIVGTIVVTVGLGGWLLSSPKE